MLKQLAAIALISAAVAVSVSCSGPAPIITHYSFTTTAPTDAPTAVPTETPTPIPTEAPTEAPVPTAAPTDYGKKMYVTLDGSLRVRNAPKTGDILGFLLKNDVVLILEENVVSGWHKIQTHDGTIGYVSANYLADIHERAVLSDLKQ